MGTATKVIEVLKMSGFIEKTPGVWVGNRPWDPNADSGTFEVKIQSEEVGTAVDRTRGNAGFSLYQLADKLGISVDKGQPANTKIALTHEEYAISHGLTLETMRQYGWAPIAGKRAGFRFTTPAGDRFRYIDGLQPRYQHAKGYKPCWYYLDAAVKRGMLEALPLLLCNGEISVVAALNAGIPATCITSGAERGIPELLLETLKSKWSGPITVALDCDPTGRDAGEKLTAQLRNAGFVVVNVDLQLGHGGDVADWLRLYPETPKALYDLPRIVPPPPEVPKTISAGDLQKIEFAPQRFIVDELFIPGCYLVVGKPKSRKSFLMLHIALMISRGQNVFGQFITEKCGALYLDLEGNDNGVYTRLKMMSLVSDRWPTDLHFGFSDDWNQRGLGAVMMMDTYLTANPHVKFVVIDVLQNFREPVDGRALAYAEDYNAIKPIQRLAHKHGIVICIIHHTRKAKSDDPFDEVSGTTGLTGAVDGTIIIRRDETDQTRTVLETRYRNMPDRDAIILQWDTYMNCHKIDDPTPLHLILGFERRRVLEIMATGEEFTAVDIARQTDKTANSVTKLLGRMESEGLIGKVGRGKYQSIGERINAVLRAENDATRQIYPKHDNAPQIATLPPKTPDTHHPAPGLYGRQGYYWLPVTDAVFANIPIEFRASIYELKNSDLPPDAQFKELTRVVALMNIGGVALKIHDLFYKEVPK
ncbi:Archaeal primase DnaG/twinkle, TOPRIM domain [uncultured Caudovirales phage]|uniref:Archaeal primase DnaG/twinkle, TOPRIM domain n=1 Tax=uncultured Caudovirales phage TaxID=2100421 RepID=A0A6J5QUI1_9CAUD|nr:Archaeal primase DnaG/twinkle, TOPRIM domain [uncultured Caudovirales phage]CAB4185051.1 Archaeal primase DnaG/twinkle, TOPRIM domain [uncultured Caudovirales phage]CAB4189313.1 Archaeal primase DnaG/twinkle, TOPRIM domain [uncultured Caudovirales phage]CAB4217546.1 Archaeal primase DnaG/twinkle, TOPRIM domain [uncultured Caudovirales phage]CAB4220330.1 Archaeal primase DnaG/twinkle, TOPRIM domain [uncultured Caudovirales phage]